MNRNSLSLSSLAILCLLLSSCAIKPVRPTAAPPSPSPPDSTAAPSHTPAHPTISTAAPSPAPSPLTSPIDSTPITHVVEPGDTLLALAGQYGVPMAAIQLENGLGESTILHVGHRLAIPSPAGWEAASRFWIVYVVKEGETLAGIARRYGLEMETLKDVNGLSDADRIQIGQELILPLNAPAAAFVPTPTPLPTATPTPPPTATPESTADPTFTPLSPTDEPPAPPPADIAAWPRETARIINQVRAQHGLGPLTYNEALAAAAQAHANDCQQRGWCSHVGSDGSDVKQRIIRAGYDPAGWAECWAWNRTPQAAVDAWMDEVPPNDPHRRTLLSPWLTEIGLGVAEAPSWGYFFIADFGRP